jgi:LEA14-like dessication related protein
MFVFMRLIPVLAIVFLMGGCIPEDPVELRKLEQIKFRNISKEGISLDIVALIENKTAYKFKVSDAHLDIMLNQVSIGKVRLKEDCIIKRKSSQPYTFNVETKYSDLLAGGIASLVNLAFKKKIRCSCKGWIEAGKWGVKRKIPVEFDEEVDFEGIGKLSL